MNALSYQNDTLLDWLPSPRIGVRQRMARALVGQEVSLRVNADTITHGIVVDVLGEMDYPQIVVGKMAYDMDQVLTHVPASFGNTVAFQPQITTTTK